MRRLCFFLLAFLLIEGCVDPLDVPIPAIDYQLVVDGFITNEPGPYRVRLHRARPLERDLDQLVPERSAKVTLLDDAGNSELLNEVSDGVYQTSASGMQGQVGRMYHLEIRTLVGKQLYTDPELLLPPGEIENVSFQFEQRTSGDGFRIVADGIGLEGRDDFLRFRFVGTYEVETYPHLRTKRNEAGIVPDPFPCSGYVVDQSGLKKADVCTCCICWVNQYDDVPILRTEQFAAADRYVGIDVAFVPVNTFTFYKKYHAEVQQLSLTEFAHNFWSLVRAQKLGVSDIFQPPVSSIQGNLHSLDPNDKPLGIFWAAGISRKSVFIEKSDVPYLIQPIDTVIAPCQYLNYSTNQRPEFWE